ncbi:hypothetical protein BH18THE1_BH18THE1_09970 [soil metagenome]
MSLCYDFEMWNIITLSAILAVCLVGIVFNLGIVFLGINWGKSKSLNSYLSC